MDARERWQALQAQLTLARTALDAGNRADALSAIDAALAIDPDFLAAHALRERALQLVGPPRPLVSTEGYAKFEQRARRRRVDRRIDAAREAIATERLKDAAAALDEVIELDPNLPELAELTAAFDTLRKNRRNPHKGRWLAAAAAFVLVILGASWLQEGGGLKSRPLIAMAPIASPSEPPAADSDVAVVADAAAVAPPVATSGTDLLPTSEIEVKAPATPPPTLVPGYVQPVPFVATPELTVALPPPSSSAPSAVTVIPPPPSPLPGPSPALIAPPAASSPSASVVSPPPPPPPTATPAPTAAALEAPVAAMPAPVPTAPAVAKIDEEAQIQKALQRYRTAYDGLDARSARAVWPAVNEAALARAFDGLESQNLTFDACAVQLHGEAADATCRGSARYVPKIGNREPRVEPRTWSFTLRKSGADWQIESARTGR